MELKTLLDDIAIDSGAGYAEMARNSFPHGDGPPPVNLSAFSMPSQLQKTKLKQERVMSISRAFVKCNTIHYIAASLSS